MDKRDIILKPRSGGFSTVKAGVEVVVEKAGALDWAKSDSKEPLTEREKYVVRRALGPLIEHEKRRMRAARIYLYAIRYPIYTMQGALNHSFWNSETRAKPAALESLEVDDETT